MLERLFGRKKNRTTQSEIRTEDRGGNGSPEASASISDSAQDSAPESAQVFTQEQASSNNAVPAPTDAGPAPARELEIAMQANVNMDTPDTRLKVYQELLFSELLLALAETPQKVDENSLAQKTPQGRESSENGTPHASEPKNEGQNISVAILKNAANMQFCVAFTSGAAARKWRPEGGNYVSIKGQDAFKLLEASPAEVIVINPASIPFIVLPKLDYKQLALGVVPQNTQSPVQNPPPPSQAEQQANAQAQSDSEGQMQIAFPPDVFSEDQKSFARTLLLIHTNVEAAVFGAIKAPGAKENEWVRTIFIRVIGIEPKQEVVQKLCQEIRLSILENQSLFKDINFEVGIMPDPQFWIAMHQNNIVLFDKNPPELPSAQTQIEKPSGVVDATE